MELKFSGKVWHWRGPSPYYFVTVPEGLSAEIRILARLVTYGWGMVPVHAQIGRTRWTTSLFPKDGLYVVPLKDSVRQAEHVGEGDTVQLDLELRRSKAR